MKLEAKLGEFVRTWFNTGGKTGTTIIFGVVIAAGPKAVRVRWESGTTNRVRRDDPGDVTACPTADVDDTAFLRLLHVSPPQR